MNAFWKDTRWKFKAHASTLEQYCSCKKIVKIALKKVYVLRSVSYHVLLLQHVVQGKMAYAPILVRLGKGFSEINVHGKFVS